MYIKTKPCYVILSKQFHENCYSIESAFQKHWGKNLIFGYSVKTNHNSQLINLASQREWYIEVVSEDEYHYIESLSIPEHKVICNGPVKGSMMENALKKKQIVNLDNLEEVYFVCNYKRSNPHVFLGPIGLRVNFDLESFCHGETTAGSEPIRFGINYENGDLSHAISLLAQAGITVDGLHMHSSTKTRSLSVYKKISEMVCEIITKYDLHLQYIDIGGGFFGGQVIPGKPLMQDYADVICSQLKKFVTPEKVTLILEPGSSVIATSVKYVTHVVNIRDIGGNRMVTLDGTLLHINPLLNKRDANYATHPTGTVEIPTQHLCGCTCMEMDRLGILNNSKELLPGDEIVFYNVGAYTMSFNSNFIIAPPDVILD